jgi:hypothetical protein
MSEVSVYIKPITERRWKLCISIDGYGVCSKFTLQNAENVSINEWMDLCDKKDIVIGDGFLECRAGSYILRSSSRSEYGEVRSKITIHDEYFSSELRREINRALEWRVEMAGRVE